MSEPLQKGGPMPEGVGDPMEPPVHPGFYKGDDGVEWARNKAALLKFVNFQLRAQNSSSADPLIAANDYELRMLEHLLGKVTP